MEKWIARFPGQRVDVAVEACTGWLVVCEALQRAGAAFVSLLPRVLDRYAESLPLVAEPGTGGIGPTQMSRFIYGLAVVLVLLYAPRGLVAVRDRLRERRPRGPLARADARRGQCSPNQRPIGHL